ncbi:hypothetical protein BDN71DRAFT_1439284 [Pleurotus eryngii]|uniref:Rho GTPase-activating protein 39 n=1 Tax=Pleurotus eryngii TaxID=5323 RepID=A0A9P6DL20_PLEER|nr:hypothetical protein BDN71DRAFT_1439284 [Pleurotus eryngii]
MTLSTQSASNIPVSAPSSPPELKPEQLDPHQRSKAADGAESPSKTTPRTPRTPKSNQQPANANGGDDSATWGSNFWVTLVDPQTHTSFYACPATGQVSWDPPVGNFVLPPSTDGEWWELSDDSRGGIPYYYQTKTGETVWERPPGFVIPLGIVQDTALGRRLSFHRLSKVIEDEPPEIKAPKPQYRRSKSYANGQDGAHEQLQLRRPNSTAPASSPSPTSSQRQHSQAVRRSVSSDQYSVSGANRLLHPHSLAPQLPTIPGSPYMTEASSPPSPSSQRSMTPSLANGKHEKDSPNGKSNGKTSRNGSVDSATRSRSKSSSYVPRRSPPAQSLNAAAELLVGPNSDNGHSPGSAPRQSTTTMSSRKSSANEEIGLVLSRSATPTKDKHNAPPPSPRRPIPAVPGPWKSSVAGRGISNPIPNNEATFNMSPVKNRAAGKPIPVEPTMRTEPSLQRTNTATLRSGTYPILPHDLASAIQQFSESDYAKQYFSTHRTGFIFRRKVPVAQMMTWQKPPLTSPLLTIRRSLHKDAVKVFKVVQHIMGDRERERSVSVRVADTHVSTVASINGSSTSVHNVSILEEERWLLGEGLTHGELRDEIYCQVMKQLIGNHNAESVFKGWQLLCVLLITFPPSKNFETYLRSFIQQRTSHSEGRVDVMAKYCLRRLTYIAKKGPRGKPPTVAEIEIASDAAFNPSTFGESLDAIIRLQERNYPQQKVPIILPFLADGILALGGPKSEGIFRVPGDGDSVSELKLRIDQGYYTLDGVDDPHVLASLMKLWLRELCDPLVPEEMYNECITSSNDPEACVRIIERLPTINRRVVLFVISFLQLFLDDRIQTVTKMTPANLALVMAPNLLRCNSESMAIVFTNAQFEQIFVYHLLLHLKSDEIDSDYVPVHGLGAVPTTPAPRVSKSRSRR